MDDEERAIRNVRTLRILQPVAVVFLSLFAGIVCPYVAARHTPSADTARWQVSVLLDLHWHWTLPVGIGLAMVLFWSLGRIRPIPGLVFGFLVSLALVTTAAFLTYALLSLA